MPGELSSLRFAIVNDVAGIVIIALAYSGHIDLAALGAGVAILGVVIVAAEAGVRRGLVYLVLGVAGWVAFFESGVDPVVTGRYVWRHLPLTDVHPHALLAAEGAEAAANQGRFWDMHDQLLDHQGALTAKDLIGYAAQIGLDPERFTRDLGNRAGEAKILADMDSADLSGVSGTPTFFVNGRRHHGAYDLAALSDAVRAARAQVLISPAGQPR